MLNTVEWTEIDLGVLKEIRLDPKNVRLELSDAKVEADIIEDLFVNEKVLELVEGICTIGYLTHEIPIAVEHLGQYIMVEGNRRLAALKAIQNPMLVPEFQARVERYTRLLPDKGSLAKIRVMVAPNRDDADRLIAAIHTSNLRKRWTPARQAAFFQAQIDSGRQLQDLVNRYPTIKVRRFVFSAHILNLFKGVNFESQELTDFLASKQGRKGLSTLARIYESKEFLDLTGFSMDETGRITKGVSDREFKEIATIVIQGMVDGNIDTRSINTVKSPRYTQLMRELRSVVSTGSSTEVDPATNEQEQGKSQTTTQVSNTPGSDAGQDVKFTSGITNTGSNSSSRAKKEEGNRTSKRSASPRKKKRTTLDLSQVTVPSVYPEALRVLVGELSEINIQKFPNITFLTLRSVLERSIKAYAEQRSEDIRRSGSDKNGRVQLSHALNWLREDVTKNGPRYLVQVIDGVKSSKIAYNASQDSLNAINHNHHFMVDPEQVLNAWAAMSSIIRHVMKP